MLVLSINVNEPKIDKKANIKAIFFSSSVNKALFRRINLKVKRKKHQIGKDYLIFNNLLTLDDVLIILTVVKPTTLNPFLTMRRQAIDLSKAFFSCVFFMLFIFQASFVQATEDDLRSRYAILIAEIITSPKKDDYKKLKNLGDVYYVIQTPGYKVYLGSYGSYDSAIPTLSSVQKSFGFSQAKIESIPAGTVTNLMWRQGEGPDSYDTFTAKGVIPLPVQQELSTEIRVYQYQKGSWATSKEALKLNTNKVGIYNEMGKSLVLDQDLTQRIYLDVHYKNHKVNPMDLQLVATFGSETQKLVYNRTENSFEFNGTQLKSFPTQFTYQMKSERYGIQTEVNVPVRWVRTTPNEVSSYYYNNNTQPKEYSTKGWALKTNYSPTEYSLLPSEDDDEVEEYSTRIKRRDEAEQQIPSGYYVQIVALGRRPDLQKFMDLSRYSDVLYTYENSFYKVLVGGFETKAEAQTALRGIKKSYKKAYIIEVGDVSEGGLRDDFIPKGYSAKSERINTQDTPQSYSYAAPRKQYVVKLAAYSDPDYFDDTQIKEMGTCWEIKKGRLTVKYITLKGLKTPYQANAALRDIREAGFREAFLMTKDEKGRLVRVD